MRGDVHEAPRRASSALAQRSHHRELQRFLGLRLGLGVALLRERGPLLLEFGLARALFLGAGEGAGGFLADGLGFVTGIAAISARASSAAPGLRVVLLGERRFGLVDRLGRLLQIVELERDQLVEQRVDDVVRASDFLTSNFTSSSGADP